MININQTFITASAKTEKFYKLCKGRIYGRAVVSDSIGLFNEVTAGQQQTLCVLCY